MLAVPVDGAGPARSRLFGTKTRPLLVHDRAPVEKLEVRFRPGAAARFFRPPATELVDAGVDLEALWGPPGAALLRSVGDAGDPLARAARVEEALLVRLDVAEPDPATSRLVVAAVAALERSAGRLRVDALCGELGVGERRLERAFRARVGIAPKSLARILRFRRACARLAAGEPQAHAAAHCGYADQAHLQRDFRQLAHTAPGRWISESARLSETSNPVGEGTP